MELRIAKAKVEEKIDLDAIRPDLQEVIDRHRFTLDEARPEAVARRRKTGHRTARENIADLLDPGSFIEYGALTIAAQRRRRTLDDLIKSTPADGLIAGVGTVNAGLFGRRRRAARRSPTTSRCWRARRATSITRRPTACSASSTTRSCRVVWYAEGGGGRPGDTDAPGVAGLDVTTFAKFARLSGEVAEDRHRRGPLLRRQRRHRWPAGNHRRHKDSTSAWAVRR